MRFTEIPLPPQLGVIVLAAPENCSWPIEAIQMSSPESSVLVSGGLLVLMVISESRQREVQKSLFIKEADRHPKRDMRQDLFVH